MPLRGADIQATLDAPWLPGEKKNVMESSGTRPTRKSVRMRAVSALVAALVAWGWFVETARLTTMIHTMVPIDHTLYPNVPYQYASGETTSGSETPISKKAQWRRSRPKRRLTSQVRRSFSKKKQTARRRNITRARTGRLTEPVEHPVRLVSQFQPFLRTCHKTTDLSQREARDSAVLPGPQESPPRGQAAAEHERGGRDPVGDCPDSQARGRQRGGDRAIRAAPRRRHRRGRWRGRRRRPGEQFPPLRAGHDPRRVHPAPTISFPPLASTPAAT